MWNGKSEKLVLVASLHQRKTKLRLLHISIKVLHLPVASLLKLSCCSCVTRYCSSATCLQLASTPDLQLVLALSCGSRHECLPTPLKSLRHLSDTALPLRLTPHSLKSCLCGVRRKSQVLSWHGDAASDVGLGKTKVGALKARILTSKTSRCHEITSLQESATTFIWGDHQQESGHHTN